MRSVICVVAIMAVLIMSGYLLADSHVAKKLSLQEQQNIRGGCDIDCEDTGTCNTRPACTSDDQCTQFQAVCTDTTDIETCSKETKLGWDCVYDDSHSCSPKVLMTGYCDTLIMDRCKVEGNQGECGTTATQCHY
ncbi:hypothetical protein KAR91_00205 [Candidatus Pacearchaeota archaeon]|nr:hypothetical protein [Candidatus Pacearchaeota archaeon]